MLSVTTKDAFVKEVLEYKDGPVLVDFYADWCGPCRMLAPIIEDVVADGKTKTLRGKIVKVDVDAAQELAGEYGVMSIPTLYVFREGKAVKQMVGVQQKSVIMNALAQTQ